MYGNLQQVLIVYSYNIIIIFIIIITLYSMSYSNKIVGYRASSSSIAIH